MKSDIIFILFASTCKYQLIDVLLNSNGKFLLYTRNSSGISILFFLKFVTNSGETWKNFSGGGEVDCNGLVYLQYLLIAVKIFLRKDTRWRISNICIRAVILFNAQQQQQQRTSHASFSNASYGLFHALTALYCSFSRSLNLYEFVSFPKPPQMAFQFNSQRK